MLVPVLTQAHAYLKEKHNFYIVHFFWLAHMENIQE